MAIQRGYSSRFYRQIVNSARRKGVPVKVVWELTYCCNFACVHCKNAPDKTKRELTTLQVMQIIDQLADANCLYVHFTGGEPLLRKDIFRILQYAKKKGFRFSIGTNGSLINKKVAEKIASLRPNLIEVNVSLLSVTKNTFNKLTGSKNGFDKVIHAVNVLRSMGIKISMTTTLFASNQSEFLLTKKFAERFGAQWKCNYCVFPKTDGNRSPLRHGVAPAVAHALFEKIGSKERASLKGDAAGSGRKRIFTCGVGRSDVTISPYGEMNLCPYIFYPQYNILAGSFQDGWKTIKRFVKGLRPGENYFCKDCALFQTCPWCPAEAWLERKEFTGCTSYDRQLALLKARELPSWGKVAKAWKTQRKRFMKRKEIKSR